ncbi:MAG: efflux RND transporter periplasmic adaptor subunit [Bacteroidetes bacterium]|nr:MAG: efflux RND transporter periplasmic adaptor subunit [Bacteroidota bacterium]
MGVLNRVEQRSKLGMGVWMGSLFLMVLLNSCSGGGEDAGAGMDFAAMFGGGGRPTSVEVMEVQTGTITDEIRSFGTVRAQDVVNVTPQVSNRVVAIYADLGDSVSQGDPLAKIYDVPFRDAYQQAQSQFLQAQTTFRRDSVQFERQTLLFETGSISASEFENVRATFENSRSQLESAGAAITQSLENLNNTVVRSPVNGVVLSRSIAEGDIASGGQTMFEVANLTGYETRLYLPLKDWEEVRIGLDVALSLSNEGTLLGRGTISRISPQLDEVTGLGEVVVSLTDVSPRLRQGMLAESRITLETRENRVIIPRSAMIERIDTYIEPETNTVELRRSYSVFVAMGDTVAMQRELTLGLEQGERIEVLSGLRAGEKLIVTGQANLRMRAPIRVANLPDAPGEGDGEGIEVLDESGQRPGMRNGQWQGRPGGQGRPGMEGRPGGQGGRPGVEGRPGVQGQQGGRPGMEGRPGVQGQQGGRPGMEGRPGGQGRPGMEGRPSTTTSSDESPETTPAP